MNKKLFTSLRLILVPMFVIGLLTMFLPDKEWMNNIPHPLAFGWGCGSLFVLLMHTVFSYLGKYVPKNEGETILYSSFRYILIPSTLIGLTLSFFCMAKESILNLPNPFMTGYTISALLILFAHCIFCHLGSREEEQVLK